MSLYEERHLRTPQHKISRDKNEEELEFLRSLREHTEKKILCGLYQAESLIAAGEVLTAAYRLENTIGTFRPIDRRREKQRRTEDGYFRSLVYAWHFKYDF